MKWFGMTLDLMSLGGLAISIGLVVDDAIVVTEAIVRRLEEGLPPAEAADRGTQDLFAAVVGTTLTTVVVFAPLALLSGITGSFLRSLAGLRFTGTAMVRKAWRLKPFGTPPQPAPFALNVSHNSPLGLNVKVESPALNRP
jgi:Cu/Ag efflux pump CusA